MIINYVIAVGGLLIFDTIAMKFITSYAKTDNQSCLIYAIGFEIIAWVFLIKMLRLRGLAVANAIWDIGSLILVTSIAVLVFHEHLKTHHYVGIILGIMSILLLLKNGEKST